MKLPYTWPPTLEPQSLIRTRYNATAAQSLTTHFGIYLSSRCVVRGMAAHGPVRGWCPRLTATRCPVHARQSRGFPYSMYPVTNHVGPVSCPHPHAGPLPQLTQLCYARSTPTRPLASPAPAASTASYRHTSTRPPSTCTSRLTRLIPSHLHTPSRPPGPPAKHDAPQIAPSRRVPGARRLSRPKPPHARLARRCSVTLPDCM